MYPAGLTGPGWPNFSLSPPADLHPMASMDPDEPLPQGGPAVDTLPEHVYDDISRLTAQICGAPIAVMTLIDRDRQWVKSRIGVDVRDTPRADAFWAETVRQDRLLIVSDAREDARFAQTVAAATPAKTAIRFYVGAPLQAPGGAMLGVLCVMDREPRTVNRAQQEAVRALARQAVAQLELKRTVGDLERMMIEREEAEQARRESERRFQMFMNHSPLLAYIKDRSGRFVYVNEPFAKRFGLAQSEWLGKTDADLFGNEIAEPLRKTDLRVLKDEVMVTVEESTPTPDGRSHDWLSHKFPLLGADGRKELAGISLDITERKKAEREREQLLAELRKALAEVKALSGLLPVCASCKSIRNDDGYWQKMEAYLREHSDVEFTHGLCPPCVEKLYPDFAKNRREAGSELGER